MFFLSEWAQHQGGFSKESGHISEVLLSTSQVCHIIVAKKKKKKEEEIKTEKKRRKKKAEEEEEEERGRVGGR